MLQSSRRSARPTVVVVGAGFGGLIDRNIFNLIGFRNRLLAAVGEAVRP